VGLEPSIALGDRVVAAARRANSCLGSSLLLVGQLIRCILSF